MRSLVVTSGVGPTEGAVLALLRASAGDPLLFDVASRQFYGAAPVETPSWLGAPLFSPPHPLVAGFFEHVARAHDVERVYGLGLEASAYAIQALPGRDVTPILFRGDLNFASTRLRRARHFGQLNRGADRLVLEDPWEMDKAVGHGSEVPHFRLPAFTLPRERVLRRTGDPRVAVLVPDSRRQGEHGAQLSQLMAAVSDSGGEAVVVDIRNLYGARDLAMRRGFTGTMRYRIGDCTHAVILGDSPHTWAVFHGLSNDLDRVYVEDTFNSHYLYSGLAWQNAARGTALADRLRRDLTADHHSGVAPPSPGEEPSRWAARLDSITSADVPWCFEEDPRLTGGVFDVFLSVAQIENRTNGARPQRIRNMAEAFEADTPVVRLSPHPNLLRRRGAWIRQLSRSGVRPRYFYGENSTSPMASRQTVDGVTEVIQELKSSGCRVGWFVRDLHWLSPEAEHLDPSEEEGRALVERGLYETRALATVADVFFAPCSSAIAGFSAMLRAEAVPEPAAWTPLPPAVSMRNLHEPRPRTRDDRLTLVYSGGIGGFYNLDKYLQAIAGLDDDIRCDFVVREGDVPRLERMLAAAGVDTTDGRSVSVYSGDFADYVPSSTRAVGVVLLDGDYARHAFPYKVMTALERRMPVLAYADTDYGEFVATEGLGYTCRPTAESIREAIRNAVADASQPAAAAWDATIQRNSWEARAAAAREVLRTAWPDAPRLTVNASQDPTSEPGGPGVAADRPHGAGAAMTTRLAARWPSAR